MDTIPTEDLPPVRNWPPRLRAAAAVAWSSFLAACLGTLLAFAVLDPQWIVDGMQGDGMADPVEQGWWLNRTGLYTIGFFLFWLIALVAGALTALLTERHDGTTGEGQRP